MSAHTPAAKDILGLSAPAFIEVPKFFSTVRVDSIDTITVSGHLLKIRLKGVAESIHWSYATTSSAKRAYNKMLKALA